MKTSENKAGRILKERGLRNTSIRKEVLSIFLAEEKALSKNDIEEHFEDIDRITLYRTIKAFEEKGIIHEAVDGTATSRYALCEGCTTHSHVHEHAHFHCNECGNTYCLEKVSPPDISKLKDVLVQDVELVLKGTCADCMKLKKHGTKAQ
jgi:Fur family ferric uptake transcriptional regulator